MATAKQTDQDHETEVSEKAKRRKFSDKYKLGILAKADRCTASGEIGKLLRQEGLYSSQLTAWRTQRRKGALAALGRKRGPKKTKTAEQVRLTELQCEVDRLRKKLAHAEKIISVQKKLSEVLGIQLEEEHDATGNC